MKDIFISYRRSDSSDVTGRIFDQLKAQFGEDRLFKDVDSIPLGKDFRSVISEAVGQCSVLLAVIGDDWREVKDDQGNRRIDDPNDYVHIEIAAALQRQIPVVPVLVENTPMPRADELPEPIRDLSFRNGIPVRTDPDFHNDMNRLCAALRGHVRRRRPTINRKTVAWGITGTILAVAFIFLFAAAMGGFGPGRKNGETTTESTSIAAASISTPVPIRYWIDNLPEVQGDDAAKLFSNALGSWQTVVETSIRKADSRAEANVIINVETDMQATVSGIGPPTSGAPLEITFGSNYQWTPRVFEATSCRMLGHVLGLEYSETPGQLMSHPRLFGSDPAELPLAPQAEDVARVREIWGK